MNSMDNLACRATLTLSMLWIEQLLSLVRRSCIFGFMLAAMLVFGDQFPFSDFPMYSVLPDSLISMRITDAEAKLLPSVPAFNVGTTVIKKQMARELNEMKARGEIKLIKKPPLDACKKAGQNVLNWLLENHAPLDPKLSGAVIRLEQTTYTVSNGTITTTTDVIAEGKAKAAKP